MKKQNIFKTGFIAYLLFAFIGCSSAYQATTRNMGLSKLGYELEETASAKEFEQTRQGANITKLQAESVYGDSIRGYLGYIWNEQSSGVTYVIRDHKGVRVSQGFLSPRGEDGCSHKKQLMPTSEGRKYTVTIKTRNGTFNAQFPVLSVIDDIGTAKGHWHVRIMR